MSRVAVVPCADYDGARVDESVARPLELLGGAEKFVSPSEGLLLKPNLLKGAPPPKKPSPPTPKCSAPRSAGFARLRRARRFPWATAPPGALSGAPCAGRPRRMGPLMASEDPVALDRVACEAAGLGPARLRTLAAAGTIGWGEADLSKIDIADLPLEVARLSPPLAEPNIIPVGFSVPRVVKSALEQQWLVRVGEPIRRIS